MTCVQEIVYTVEEQNDCSENNIFIVKKKVREGTNIISNYHNGQVFCKSKSISERILSFMLPNSVRKGVIYQVGIDRAIES